MPQIPSDKQNQEERISKELISEKAQMMELVRKLELAQEIGKIGYWELDLVTHEIFWSDEVYKIWGVEKESFKPKLSTFEATIHPEDFQEFLKHQDGAIAGLHPLDMSHRIILPFGEIKYVHEKGILETDSISGNPRFKGTVQDITLQKTFELELVKRNQFIEETLKNLPLGITVNQISTGKVTYINPAFSKIYGWPEEDFTDLGSFFEKIYPNLEYRNYITNIILNDIESGVPERMEWREIPISTQQGETRIISAKNIPLPDQDLMISTVIDETDRYWAQQALQKSNERFHLATEAVSDAVSDWDIPSEKIFWGKGFHRLFGYPETMEYVSPDFWESKVHPDDLQKIMESIIETRKNISASKWTGEYRFQKFDGTYAFVKENTIIIRDQTGIPIRIVGALQDITERKEAEKKIEEYNERFNIIANATNDAIWDWKIDTGEHFWSEGFNRFLEEDVAGIHFDFSKWSDRIHPEDKQKITDNLYRLLGDPSIYYFQTEYRFIKKSGEAIYVIDKGRIIRDEEGKAIRMVGAIQDITERKSYEESLKTLNTRLEQINHDLEISNKELEQFAYVASHDLQEPLRMISSFLGLIEKKYEEVLDEKGRQYIHFAVDGAKRMREIMLDLLEFSRVGDHSEVKTKLNTHSVIQEILLYNKKLIEEKKAKIHLGRLVEIFAHRNSIFQLFQNLILNSLKYQPENQIPEIWIESQDEGDHWKFSIKDNGIGIEHEYHEKIFIIFQRLHQREEYSGSGIGLAICKKIVEIHGGKIWLESIPGQGSTFFFSIKKPF
ncbi:PAS domain-containing protein [Algoriphagus sp. CAU 1675]|uniref:PAS domain-containing protein n=1 Tax=Algoriphagus sp. CAU 1675 TaxID=3032597 RepID=UPI0023DC24A4|nr:PAS domain-containing protein [Algoriphagus sp. CAU 1675]MDF2157060.1 PAS domain-containing protein [Algoriphagus sp. CAU 1675]